MKVVVLGAGIAGLATGWYLKKRFGNELDLTIIEKSERVGGWIRTVRKGDFVFETGPRGFRSAGKGEATLELVRELGLKRELVVGSRAAKKRYIALGGKLQPFGLGFLLRQGLIGAVVHELRAPKGFQEDETVASFMQRRFNQKIANRVMDPLTKGIFGGDMHSLSMRSCFPSLWKMEQEKGSLIRGMLSRDKKKKVPTVLYTFREGMETLPDALATELNGHIRLGSQYAWEKADCVISTLPARELATLVGCDDPCSYATLTLVHLGWREAVLPKRGYGFLVPSEEKAEILGMTWDSEIFPKGEQTRICVMISGNESHAVQKALNSLQKYLGIASEPDVIKISLAENAIPQYTLHHETRMAAFKRQLPANMKAIGTSFAGPGVNDAIFSARELVRGLSFSQ